MTDSPVDVPPPRQRGKPQRDGVLAGHFRQGQTFRSPMAAWDVMTVTDWVRDDLPDLLWPITLLAVYDDEGIERLLAFQRCAFSALTDADIDPAYVHLDGRLTSLDSVDPALRPAIVEHIVPLIRETEVLPSQLVDLFTVYAGMPGRWLLAPEMTADSAAETALARLAFLAPAIGMVAGDRHRNAAAKAPTIAWRAIREPYLFDDPLLNALHGYPSVDKSRGEADAVILSSFLASKGRCSLIAPEEQARQREWAASFWRSNWHLTGCIPEEVAPIDRGAVQKPTDDGELDEENESNDSDLQEAIDVDNLIADTANDLGNFIETVLDNGLDVDLYSRRSMRSSLV